MPVKQGTFGTSPIYNGEYKIGKIYNGENLVYQSVEYPTMIAYVKKYEYEGDGSVEGGKYFKVEVGIPQAGEIITLTYGGKTVIVDESTGAEDVLFGTITYSGGGTTSSDSTPDEGWITIKSNLQNTPTTVNLCRIETRGAQSYVATSAFAGNIIKGNYAFSGLIGNAYTNPFGYFPDSIIFETTKHYAGSVKASTGTATIAGTSAVATNITLGNNTSFIDDYAFGQSSGSVDYTTLTFSDTTNRHIDIKPNAFKVKTASAVNIYTYGNDSVLEYDWTAANSGAVIYNNGVVVPVMGAPTVSLSGENIVITPATGATKYILSFTVGLATYTTTVYSSQGNTIPISSLDGYSSMASGTAYTITIKNYGKGYLTSKGATVSYTKA